VKCGDCTRQAFKPVDDAAVFAHLKGQHVMGVYPMQEDETCWFLAVDFDKSAWMDDVRAFVQTSRRLGLPVAVERSRSGNGAHVWFFFATPVAAATTRKMGCYLITETMASRHELGMDSYDRLFPSQDTMPRGGFGNLIALPLQHGPRQEGNSIFLNDDLIAFPDEQQWAHLASIKRIDTLTVERIASDASRAGSVVGLRMTEEADDEETAPWTRLPADLKDFLTTILDRVELDPTETTMRLCYRIPLRSGFNLASPGGVGSIPTIVARSLATLTGTSVRELRSGRLQHTSSQ
jgi:hypothetical protein